MNIQSTDMQAKNQNKPELCCTCGDWHPFKDDLLEGICKNTNCSAQFDENCAFWVDCENKNVYGASKLGYD